MPLAEVEHLATLSVAIVQREARPSTREPRGAAAHGEALEVKLGGLNAPTQDVSGAPGSARNDTITACAQGDQGETMWPMPGMLMMVALDSFSAAASAPARDVNVSKLPEMRSVGMLLSTGWCMVSGAAGTFQTSRQSSLKYAQPPTPSRCIEAG